MSDDSFFREVEEELRNERLQSIWTKYGTYLIAAAIALVVGVAVWRYLDYSNAQQAAEAGELFAPGEEDG